MSYKTNKQVKKKQKNKKQVSRAAFQSVKSLNSHILPFISVILRHWAVSTVQQAGLYRSHFRKANGSVSDTKRQDNLIELMLK